MQKHYCLSWELSAPSAILGPSKWAFIAGVKETAQQARKFNSRSPPRTMIMVSKLPLFPMELPRAELLV
ncbi:MAG TPA: hypothetical protein VKH63_21935 [Candidatus Acidoferrum sp.]|nr:hypothetical protein [Candidatus Acidoferrum sp.]